MNNFLLPSPPHTKSPFKIIIGGYINVNVIDGSAFFLSGVTALCAQNPHVTVYLVTANPISRLEVLDELLKFPNVKIIDPFSPEYAKRFGIVTPTKPLDRYEYGALVAQIGNVIDPDALLIRDTEAAVALCKTSPGLASRTTAYITGVRHIDEPISDELRTNIESLRRSGSRLACQTTPMQEKIASECNSLAPGDIFVLPPHIPDPTIDAHQIKEPPSGALKMVYTGKFFKDWNTDKIFASFKALQSENPDIELHVAGDQFRRSQEDQFFVANTRYFLDHTPGLIWHGGVPRRESRRLIEQCDVGIGWRAPSLDSSTELSTKILEYGALGVPSIINRTELHESVFGKDYPLFANTTGEFKRLVRTIIAQPSTIHVAAERCFEVSARYSYSETAKVLFEHFGNREEAPATLFSTPLDANAVDQCPAELLDSFNEVTVDGQWVRILPNTSAPISVRQALSEISSYLRLWGQYLRQADTARTLVSNEILRSGPLQDLDLNPDENKEIQFSSRKAANLESENRKLQSQLEATRKRLTALQQSKLGRIQVEIWKQRGGNRKPGGSSNDLIRKTTHMVSVMSRKLR